MKEGPLAGQRFHVDAQLVVGRTDGDVTIEDPLISRQHALIRLAEDSLEIEDLGSLNGTWVNGERLESARRLRPGDLVQVGSVSFEVEGEPAGSGGTILAPLAPAPPAAASAASPTDETGRGEPAAEPQATEDELRPVTALFADIVGSTMLGERLRPDEVKLVIGEFVNRMSRCVEQFGGSVHAYMGDGIAAFFGAPRAHEDDAERAARAALAIVEEAERYAHEVEGAWEIPDFNIRVGINTGETAVGLVGAAAPQAVSVGDTTNVAARLQAAADPGSIVVGHATATSLIRTFDLEPLGDVTVKGRREPVSAWRLLGTQATIRATFDTPLVGRESELTRLETILDELVAGRGQIAVLLGEAGLGKTRLVAEQRKLASGRVTWLEGNCFSYGTEIVYGPFIQILRSWIGAEEGEAELSVRTKLRAKLGLLPASQIPDVLPHLARLLSLKLDDGEEERLGRASPADLAREIRGGYQTWVGSLASQGPVVVAIEDVHWADTPSRRLIDELLELAEQAPVLVLMTLRIDPDSEGWGARVHALSDYPHRTTELRLMPLDDAGSRLLLGGLPRSRELRETELDLILRGAEGNPLYLEELVNAFADTAGSQRGHTWASSTVIGPKVLTPTLESLLLARVDALSDSCRRLAQLAAVIGRIFPLRVLESIADSDDIEGDLNAVVRADIIRELRRYPEPEYIFRHGLLWRACLTTLTPARRRALHGAVAAAFETLFAPSLDDHLEVIAYHFARSDNLAKALSYLEIAGERAAALDASQQAEELWSRALRIAEKLSDAEAQQRVRQRLSASGASSA
jgi:class 3 adenylate cyclase